MARVKFVFVFAAILGLAAPAFAQTAATESRYLRRYVKMMEKRRAEQRQKLELIQKKKQSIGAAGASELFRQAIDKAPTVGVAST
ncbi:MAG: hypothetical protein AAFU77_05560 [Myxococcota bacterium]